MVLVLAAWLLALGPAQPPPSGPVERSVVDIEPGSEEFEPPPLTPPKLVESPTAFRPAERADEEVEVLLSLEIDTEGTVTAVEVVTSGGAAFDEAAIEAARRFAFEPAKEGEAPIPVQIQYLYVFSAVEVEPEPEPELPTEPTIDDTEVVMAPSVDSEAVQSEVVAEQGERIAGTQGDAVKAAQTLGGVARPSAGTGELVVWGASPSDTRLYVDQIPVPRLFHLGGSRSVLPSPLLESVALVPGGYGPAYGRAIGGYVEARTRGPRPAADPRRVGGYARADAIDVGAAADARLTDRAWMTVALRRSVLAQTYGALAPPASLAVVPLPDYWDYQAKGVVRTSSREELTVLVLGSHDEVRRGIPSLTPDTAFSERRRSGFHRVGLRFRRQHTDGRSVTLTTWAGLDDDLWAQDFEQVRASSTRRSWRGGLRLEERRRLAEFLVLRWGIDVETNRTSSDREGAITLPAREGDLVVFGQPPGDRVGRDRWRTTQVGLGAYTSLRFELAEGRWTLEPGLRLEPMVTAGDRLFPVRPIEPEIGYTDVEVAVDPRVRLGWMPWPEVSLFAAGGRYHQAPEPTDLSPVFGNPRLDPPQAYHGVLGAEVSPTSWLALTLTGFFLRADDLTGRSDNPTPPVATLLVSDGEGRSYGGQVTARFRPLPTLFAWLSYSLMRAERQDPGIARWRRFDFDQPHVLQALAGWEHRSGVELGGRVSLSSGNPRTQIVDDVANARTGGYDPVFGEHNTDRLPMYFALSLRVGWGHAWRWGELRTWLDLQNVTNRSNTEEWFYSSDFSSRGAVEGLPILPVLGVQVQR